MNGGFLNFSVTSHGTRLFAYFQALWAGNSCQTLKTFIKWLDLEMFIKVYHRKIVRRTSQRSVNKDSLQPQSSGFPRNSTSSLCGLFLLNVPSNHMFHNISTLQQSKGLESIFTCIDLAVSTACFGQVTFSTF